MAKIGQVIKCKICGKEFVKRLAAEKYCSRECYKKAQKIKICESNYRVSEKRAMRKNNKYSKECVICGKPFLTSQSRAVCCSGACRYEYKKIKERERRQNLLKQPKEKQVGICEWCGKEFVKKVGRQVYCSKICYERYRSKNKCEKIKSTFTENPKKKIENPPSVADIQNQMKEEGYPPYAYGKYIADKYLKEQQRS